MVLFLVSIKLCLKLNKELDKKMTFLILNFKQISLQSS